MIASGFEVSRVHDKFKELERRDPLLRENPRRYVLFPIEYPEVYEMYKQHKAFISAKQAQRSYKFTSVVQH